VVRAELKRLFQWLKNKGMTTIITGEQEKKHSPVTAWRYVSTASFFLTTGYPSRSRPDEIRVVKYRGSAHDTNEFPFLIDEKGLP